MRGAPVLRIVAVAVLLGLTGCGVTSFAAAPPPPVVGVTPTPTAVAPTTASVATRVLDLRRGSRPLPTSLWYPSTGDGPFPLVVFSHGFGSTPGAYDELLSSWAAAGFVVAAPTFPMSSQGSALVTADVPNQPADVSSVLTAVLALDQTRGDALAGRIDGRHIAAAGHSAGAITTIGLLSSCCVDPRITAAVVLAGSTRHYGTTLAKPGVPTLFVHGTADTVLPLADDQKVFDATTAPAAFLQLTGGTHSAPYDDGTDPAFDTVRSVTTDFLRWALSGNRAALASMRRDATADGTAILTGDRLPH
jgi:predicted dienelactone hydrolase